MLVYCLVEESQDLSGNMLSSGFLVVHDSGGGGKDDVTELTGWEEVDDPFLEISNADVEAWGDDTALVETAVELDNNLAGAVVVDFFEFTNVALTEIR